MKNTFKLLGIISLVMIIGFSSCGDGADSGGGGGGSGNASWRLELIPDNHATEAGHKKGEWVIGNWRTGDGSGIRLWIGNNNGSSYITVDRGNNPDYEDGTKNSYNLQSAVDKPAGQESSFVIKGTSRSIDQETYTITYILASDNLSIEIINNDACINISTGTYTFFRIGINFIGNWNGTFNGAAISMTVTAGAWSVSIPDMGLTESGGYTITGNTTAIIKYGGDTVVGNASLSDNNNRLTITITQTDGELPYGAVIVLTRNGESNIVNGSISLSVNTLNPGFNGHNGQAVVWIGITLDPYTLYWNIVHNSFDSGFSAIVRNWFTVTHANSYNLDGWTFIAFKTESTPHMLQCNFRAPTDEPQTGEVTVTLKTEAAILEEIKSKTTITGSITLTGENIKITQFE